MGKCNQARTSTRDEVLCAREIKPGGGTDGRTLESKVSMGESVSWCKGHVNVQHPHLSCVQTVTRAVTLGESVMMPLQFKHKGGVGGAGERRSRLQASACCNKPTCPAGTTNF